MGEGAGERLRELTDLATPFAIRAAVTLRVAEHLAAGVDQLDPLADACGADPGALGRLLRYLVRVGLFTEPEPGRFGLTEMGALLCQRDGGGLAGYLDLDGLGARMDLAHAGLATAVRTGGPGYAAVHGRDFWSDVDDVPGFRGYFDALMHSQQERTAPEVARLYPWGEVGRVTDVGGGAGGLLAAVLSAHPHLRGTLVDRPGPVATAARTFARHGLAERAEAVVGDFFAPLPAGAEVYVISRVLSDWDDERASAILRGAARAAGPGGRVVIVEVLADSPEAPFPASYDLTMLVLVGGRARGIEDYTALVAGAGLVPARTWRGRAGLTLLEYTVA